MRWFEGSPRFVSLALAASVSLGLGCFGRANPRLAKVDEKREGGATTTFDYDDDGYLSRATRTVGEEETDTKLTWEDGVISELSFTRGEVKTKVTLTVDADERLTAWAFKEESGDETSATLAYDDAGLFTAFASHAENARFGTENDIDTTFTYRGDVLESVDTRSTERTAGVSNASESVGAYLFEAGRLVELVLDVDSVRTTSTYAYDKDDRLDEVISTIDGAGTFATVKLSLSYDEDEGLVKSYSTVSLEDGEELDDEQKVTISYDEGEARGVDMTPAAIGGLFDLRGGAYTALSTNSALRFFVRW